MPGDVDKALPLEDVPEAPSTEVTRIDLRMALFPALVALIVALVVSLATVLVVQGGQDATIRDSKKQATQEGAREAVATVTKSQAAACDRSQVVRALDRYRFHVAAKLAPDLKPITKLTDEYNQILDCNATYRTNKGKAVPLAPDLQDCFVNLVGKGYFLDHPPTSNPVAIIHICSKEGTA